MKKFEQGKKYKVGVISKRNAYAGQGKPEFTGQPVVIYYSELKAKNISDTEAFFRQNPMNLKTDKNYTIYTLDDFGNHEYFDEGTPRNPQSLGELPTPVSPRSNLDRERTRLDEERERNNATALTILENQLNNQSKQIEQLQAQIGEMITKHRIQITELQEDLLLAKGEVVKVNNELAKQKHLAAKEETLQKEYENDVQREAARLARQSGGLAGMGDVLAPLIQMGLPMVLDRVFGNNAAAQQPAPVPPPVQTVPPPSNNNGVNVQTIPSQWSNNNGSSNTNGTTATTAQ